MDYILYMVSGSIVWCDISPKKKKRNSIILTGIMAVLLIISYLVIPVPYYKVPKNDAGTAAESYLILEKDNYYLIQNQQKYRLTDNIVRDLQKHGIEIRE